MKRNSSCPITAEEVNDDKLISTSDKACISTVSSEIVSKSLSLHGPSSLPNTGLSTKDDISNSVSFIQTKEALCGLLTQPYTGYEELSLKDLCIDDQTVGFVWKLRPKRLRLIQCTFQTDSRIQTTYSFLKHYQTTPNLLEFLIRTEGCTIYCMIVSTDTIPPFPGTFDSAKTLLIILPGRIPEDVSLAHLSCILIQRSESEVFNQGLPENSRDSLIFILNHKFTEMGHLILKDLYLDRQILNHIRELDSELTHIYNCHCLSAPTQNSDSNSDQSGDEHVVSSLVNESWFILSHNPPPELYYTNAVALAIRSSKKDSFTPISTELHRTISYVLSRKHSHLIKVELQNFDLSCLAPFIRSSGGRQLFLKDCTLFSKFLLSLLCISNEKPLPEDILRFLEESQKIQQDVTPILSLLNRRSYSTHSVDSIILALPNTIPTEYDLFRLTSLILRSSKGNAFDEQRSFSNLGKIFPSIYGKCTKLKSLMLVEFLVDQNLINLVQSNSLELFRLENCFFSTNNTSVDLSSLINLERLQVTQMIGQKVSIRSPRGLEHLEVVCLGPKASMSFRSKTSDQLVFDTTYCANLNSM